MVSYAIDFKGPIALNAKKRYVLCCVELNYRLVSFSLAKSLEAKEVAQLLFDSIIKHYGGAVEIHSDRAKCFLARVSQELCQLGSIHHKFSSSYHPQSSISEGLAVRAFSKKFEECYFWKKS